MNIGHVFMWLGVPLDTELQCSTAALRNMLSSWWLDGESEEFRQTDVLKTKIRMPNITAEATSKDDGKTRIRNGIQRLEAEWTSFILQPLLKTAENRQIKTLEAFKKLPL